MFAYGQTAANAIAVMSYLAADPSQRVGSGEIAAARGISRALTAKLLTQLAAAGLVNGQPGPGGGYMLTKKPDDISLLHIASIFEQLDPPSVCGFGHGWCGQGDPCPLHHAVMGLMALNRRFMQETRLSVFLSARKHKSLKQEVPNI
jgi:Rrf2 family transcriptional regulator, iron-sulfur cluster assembly transcription factor